MPKKSTAIQDKSPYIWATARILLGLTFLWAFIDKLFGLGFATCRNAETEAVIVGCEKAWIAGGSPTTGFLKFGTKGPFADFYQSLAGNGFIDFLFMAGLLLIGVALLLGIAMKLAVYSGSLLLILMYMATLPSENNPLIDDHIIYSVVLFGLLAVNKNQRWGLREWWVKHPLVKQFPLLK